MDRTVTLVVVGLVLVAGCAGMGGQGDAASSGGDGAAPADGDGGDAGAESGERVQLQSSNGEDRAETGDAVNARVDRALIKTGTVRVEVENFSTTRAAIQAKARAQGGYVSGSDSTLHRQGNQTWETGYVVVRVPSSNFSTMLETARGQGTVLSVNTETKDVTDKLVDLNARLENLRAQRDKLRTLYEQANTTEELLKVQERLSSVQSDIERLEAKQRSLEDRVAFSTLRVEIEEPRPERDERGESTPFHEQSPITAFLNSVQSVIVFGQTLFIAGMTVLPWLLALGLPVGLFLGFRRGLGRFRNGGGGSGAAPPQKVDSVQRREQGPETDRESEGAVDGETDSNRDAEADAATDTDSGSKTDESETSE